MRLVFMVPFVGWLLRDAMEGQSDAKYYFIANVAVTWALAILFFGYPAIILPALCMVPLAFAWVIAVCR
ncbi:hypothetical protein E1162_17840 [Rhodobacteraceae bacterium RKSG542]|nr:hypothetical protein [Pseudovibrio flavus]